MHVVYWKGELVGIEFFNGGTNTVYNYIITKWDVDPIPYAKHEASNVGTYLSVLYFASYQLLLYTLER